MTSNKSLTIRQLEPADAATVADFMNSQSPEYLRFFYAFSADEAALNKMLSAAEKDVYSGVFWQNELAGIFFLRGWDEGYEIPSFGALIGEKYRGKAFFNITVDAVKLICKLSGVKGFMAKYHKDNVALQKVYDLGFYQTGVEESTGNIMIFMDA